MAADIDQLNALFSHINQRFMDPNAVALFFSNVDQYIVSYGGAGSPIFGIALSGYQKVRIQAGGPQNVDGEFGITSFEPDLRLAVSRPLLPKGRKKSWIDAASSSVAACRPLYVNSFLAPASSPVTASNPIDKPSDAAAETIWQWRAMNAPERTTAIADLKAWIVGGGDLPGSTYYDRVLAHFPGY